MDEVRGLIAEFIASTFTPGARLVTLRPRAGGAQGYSGATLRYFDAAYERTGEVGEVAVVTKPAGLNERRVLNWLGERNLPVPRNYTRDLTTDGPAVVVQEHVGDAPAGEERARSAARALAAIHHAALGRGDQLVWLPRADPAYFAEDIVQRCWRGLWRYLVTGEGYTDWYGRWREPRDAGDPFWAEFAVFDAAMEEAAARFMRDMTALWEEGESLTLIHADFHREHVRSRDGRAAIIDWGQARYGPLYTDLPNFFTRDEALLYRNALAELGHDIPRERFLAGYDAASRYVGFKYFGFGVAFWRPGDPPRRREDALKWIEMVLHGAAGGGQR
jgi:hypothetical protein